jgi:hypothetical protein
VHQMRRVVQEERRLGRVVLGHDVQEPAEPGLNSDDESCSTKSQQNRPDAHRVRK